MDKFNIAKFRPNKDKKEVFELLKDAWKANLSGEYDENFVSAHLVNPVHPGSVLKFVHVIREINAPRDSDIVGVGTSIFFHGSENSSPRGYIELLISKQSLSDTQRAVTEKALLEHILKKIRLLKPEYFEKQVRESNTVSVQVFKKAGFQETKKGTSGPDTWVILELPLQTRK